MIRSTIFDEFIMVFVQRIMNSLKNKKPPTHQGGGFNPPAGIFVQRVISPHIGGNFRPHSRHRSSPLLVCQTRFRVVPDVAWDRIITAAVGNNNPCHSKIAG
jgi:hypothetical protein